VRESFRIKAGFFAIYPIPASEKPVRVTGRFKAEGGGNDVEVYILDEDGLANFKNGRPAQTYYNSGRATVGNISITLSARSQNYYVVFSNTFSMFTSKAVKAFVTASYL